MPAFKDSSHHWWWQCSVCRLARFVGTDPLDVDLDPTCPNCVFKEGELRTAVRDAHARLDELGVARSLTTPVERTLTLTERIGSHAGMCSRMGDEVTQVHLLLNNLGVPIWSADHYPRESLTLLDRVRKLGTERTDLKAQLAPFQRPGLRERMATVCAKLDDAGRPRLEGRGTYDADGGPVGEVRAALTVKDAPRVGPVRVENVTLGYMTERAHAVPEPTLICPGCDGQCDACFSRSM